MVTDLRVGVIGVGIMGSDHAERLVTRIAGAQLVAVSDPDTARATALANRFDGVRSIGDPLALIADGGVDAVLIASPGFVHEEQVLACLERGKYTLCEKPLTMDAESSMRLVQAETAAGRPLVQVGFMRRFDPEYARMKALLDSGTLGRTLLLHNVHRNKAVPSESFRSEMIVRDSLVHEVDVCRWLFGEEIVEITILAPAPTGLAAPGVLDPQVAIFRMAGGGIATTEVFVNSQVGYEVRCEAVAERGNVTIGLGQEMLVRRDGRYGGEVPEDYRSRFARAYDLEVQSWVDATRRREVVGPTMWDGYAASAVCAAGLESLSSGRPETVTLVPAPFPPDPDAPPRDQEAAMTTSPQTTSPQTTSAQTTSPQTAPAQATPTRITHLVAGASWTGTAERTSEVFNPATGEQTGVLDLASADLVGEVVATAKAAWEGWSDASLAKRSSVLFAFRQLLDEHKKDIAALITAEHGKVLDDALGEVTRGLEVAEFACGIPHLLKGGFSENASTNVDVYSIRQSLGVVAVISPFNFPAMVPMWFIPVAIACGNAVVLKPSEKDPSAAIAVARLWTEAGLPAGVMNVVNGDKEAVDALLTHPDVKSVSFVGSTPIARYVYETGTAHGKRVQALGGAKNHMLVLPDADLDLAADAAVNAGFGSAGERCMAISALVAVEPIADELISRIVDRMGKLRTGDGTRGCDMGPLVTAAHRDKVAGYVAEGVSQGATLVVDGREQDFDGGPDGYFLGPTLFDKVSRDMSIYTEEIFGPVLSVVRVDSYDEGLELINANPYGNGTAIFTNDGGAARRFQRQVEVGMVGVNVPIPVPVSYYSFGGWKNSLFGDTHAHGMEGVHFFTRGKVVTSRWLDPSHGGLNLGFPQNT